MNDHNHDRNRTHNLDFERPPRSSRRRSSSAGRQTVLQIRASNLVKKLGIITSKLGAGARFKQDTTPDTKTDAGLAEHYPFRKARSMDVLRSEPYMTTPMLAVAGFDSQALPRGSAECSHESGSDAGEVKAAHAYGHARKSSNPNSNSIAQGLAVAAMVAGAGLRPAAPECSEPLPRPNRSANLSTGTNNTMNGSYANNMKIRTIDTLESLAPPPSDERPQHPKLSILPPLNFNEKDMSPDQRPQRFSPTVIVRPPPFPILELPALPTPIAETPASGSHAQSRTLRGGARLNSMPTLPMEGADERETDPDHENCVLDEEDEGDDEENEEDGTRESEAAGSEEEDEEAGASGRSSSSTNVTPSPTASFFSRTRSFSPKLTLPALNTPSLSSLLSGGASSNSQSAQATSGAASSSSNPRHIDAGSASGSASGSAERVKSSRDDATTPKAARASHIWGAMGNGSARTDYFSTSGAGSPAVVEHNSESESQDIDRTFSSSDYNTPAPLSSTSSALRTPTVRDYTASLTPMISVASPPPPWTPPETASSGSEVWEDKSLASKLAGARVPQLPVKDAPKRPSMYRHASKSMIELLSIVSHPEDTADAKATGPVAPDRDVKGKGKLLHSEESVSHLQSLQTKEQPEPNTLRATGRDRNARGQDQAPSTTPVAVSASNAASTLRRLRSMPTFSISGLPPPYPSFPVPDHLRRFAPPLPREDEGKEELPPYSNDIRLAAIMPRKMEFSAPSEPARDRKWRRVHCVLEGTAFRVYDAPPRVTGVSALGGWWERKVGVGDVSSGQVVAASATPGATTNIIIGRKEPRRRMKWEEELQAEEDAQRANSETEEGQPRTSTSTAEVTVGNERPREHKSKRHLAVSLLHPNRLRHSPSLPHRSSSPSSPRSSFQGSRTSADSSNPPSARPSVDLSTAASSSSALLSTAVSTNSASSSSLSAVSSNSGGSSPSTPPRRRRHLRSDSAQSINSNSRAHSPLNPDSRSQSQSQSQSPTSNSFLYHPPDSLEVPEPDERDLLRIYSLQRAECGLASDYIKRRNVVRVRMEGEQFLLQCKDVASVVEWIEALQAATNIALDLDERPMPKGPIFPRRRRRRRAQPTATESATERSTAETGTRNGTSE